MKAKYHAPSHFSPYSLNQPLILHTTLHLPITIIVIVILFFFKKKDCVYIIGYLKGRQ